MQSTASASVLPAGTIPPSASLKPGKHAITIVKIAPNNEMVLKYPDGFLRDHQAKNFDELSAKIGMFLKARYGVEAFTLTNSPALAEGANIELEI